MRGEHPVAVRSQGAPAEARRPLRHGEPAVTAHAYHSSGLSLARRGNWANIGSCLRDKGDRDGAVRMYRRALALDPSIEFARDSLGRLGQ